MYSVDLVLIDPTDGELGQAIRAGAAAVNHDQGHGEPLRYTDAEVRSLWHSLADQPEGSREWRVRGNGPLHSVAAVLVAVWWSDFLGRRHVRVVGASARRGVELPMPIPSPQYPALACLYPSTSLLVSQQRRLRVLAVCDCGAWGEPGRLAWMGPCCGPCFDRRAEGAATAPADLTARGSVVRLAFSPDGRHLAAADGCSLSRWDVGTGTQLAGWKSSPSPGQLAFSPSGELLAWADLKSHTVYLQGLGDDREGMVCGRAFAFTGDSRLIVSHHYGDRLAEIAPHYAARTWLDMKRLGPGLDERTFRLPFPLPFEGDMAVSPGGRLLAAAAGHASLLFWDVSSGEPCDRVDAGHCTGPVRWSPDGSAVAVGVQATHWKAVLWDVHRQSRRAVIGTSARLSDLAFTPDGAFLVTCEDDGLRVWDAATGQERRFLALFDDRALSVAFSPDGRLVALGTEKGLIRLWPADLLRPE